MGSGLWDLCKLSLYASWLVSQTRLSSRVRVWSVRLHLDWQSTWHKFIKLSTRNTLVIIFYLSSFRKFKARTFTYCCSHFCDLSPAARTTTGRWRNYCSAPLLSRARISCWTNVYACASGPKLWVRVSLIFEFECAICSCYLLCSVATCALASFPGAQCRE